MVSCVIAVVLCLIAQTNASSSFGTFYQRVDTINTLLNADLTSNSWTALFQFSNFQNMTGWQLVGRLVVLLFVVKCSVNMYKRMDPVSKQGFVVMCLSLILYCGLEHICEQPARYPEISVLQEKFGRDMRDNENHVKHVLTPKMMIEHVDNNAVQEYTTKVEKSEKMLTDLLKKFKDLNPFGVATNLPGGLQPRGYTPSDLTAWHVGDVFDFFIHHVLHKIPEDGKTRYRSEIVLCFVPRGTACIEKKSNHYQDYINYKTKEGNKKPPYLTEDFKHITIDGDSVLAPGLHHFMSVIMLETGVMLNSKKLTDPFLVNPIWQYEHLDTHMYGVCVVFLLICCCKIWQKSVLLMFLFIAVCIIEMIRLSSYCEYDNIQTHGKHLAQYYSSILSLVEVLMVPASVLVSWLTQSDNAELTQKQQMQKNNVPRDESRDKSTSDNTHPWNAVGPLPTI